MELTLKPWLQEVRTRFLTVSHLLQLTITLISSSSFFPFFLGDEEFDGHFTNYYEGNKFKLDFFWIKKQNKTTSYKVSRNVSSAESGPATPLFEDKDDLYDPLDSLDCSVPDIEPSSLHPDHSSVFLSPPPFRPHFSFPFRYCVRCLPTEQHHLCKGKEEVKKAITSKDETTYLN